MSLYLVSNNLVIDNIMYETDEDVQEKRITRPLSIDGEKVAVKLIKKLKGNVIYSSNYASAIGTAKYYSEYIHEEIKINSFLNDSKIGRIGSRNIKMLRFMQERDFDFKFEKGESLNETHNRMQIAINRILKKNINHDIVIFTHKRAILAYLLNDLDKGYNLDDRLILTFKDQVILDDVDNDYDIIKIDYEKGKIINVSVIE
jgi:broad specificity phosphatase PhoE